MDNARTVRKIDELGRIVLPAEVRKTMGWTEKSDVEIYIEEGRVILETYS